LGGEIRLASTPGRGSTFILYLPATYSPRQARKASADGTTLRPGSSHDELRPALTGGEIEIIGTHNGSQGWDAAQVEEVYVFNEVGDARDAIQAGDRVILVVENDLGFARFLLEIAHERGFKGLVTSLGATALALAREYKPDCISLDMHLPDIDGWR